MDFDMVMESEQIERWQIVSLARGVGVGILEWRSEGLQEHGAEGRYRL